MDHIVGLYGKTFLGAKIWEWGQKQEFSNLALVVHTYLEKFKIGQKFFSFVWRVNRMNKLSWIKLGYFSCDMWVAFPSLLREPAVNGSLHASYCEQPRQSHLIMQNFLMLECFYPEKPCKPVNLKLLNFHLVYDTLTFMCNLDRTEILKCIMYCIFMKRQCFWLHPSPKLIM